MSAKALSFTPSQHFDGNNGKWSSFIIRVGSPEQNFRVLPAPCTGAIFVPGPMGCEGSSGAPVDCADLRGVDPDHYLGFQSNVSETWHAIEKGTTEIARNLGVNSTAYFGTDSVGLMVQNSGGPTMKDQVVGSLTDNRPFFVGFFGLSPKPFNFTNFTNPYPSYLTTLRDAGEILSLSYGYTAGANYKTPKVLSSLTLGGYDESRFEPGVVTFPFDRNDDQPTSVLLQDIRSDRPLNDTRSILPEVLYVHIDFTLPYLWLPNDTCDRIASIFNLEYNSERNLYLIGEDTHAENTRNNLNLSFDLGPSRNPSERVSIDVPYAAFDLQASWPMYNVTTRFFPMKRAIESQYILGRAFMQEAYIIVDYERMNFSIRRAVSSDQQQQRLVTILGTNIKERKTGLPKNSVIGIVIGGICSLCILILVVGFCYRYTKRSRSRLRFEDERQVQDTHVVPELTGNYEVKPELVGTEIVELRASTEERMLTAGKHELQ